MIQRIQTVFLFLVTLISVLLFFIPFVEYRMGNEYLSISLMPLNKPNNVASLIYATSLVNIGILLLSAYTVFQYRNRKKQMRIARALMLVAMMLLSSMLGIDYFRGDKALWTKTYLWTSLLPIASVLFAFMAQRFIKKDEDLVRSAERIR